MTTPYEPGVAGRPTPDYVDVRDEATTRLLPPRGRGFAETKPFFLTSEFAAIVLALAALAVTTVVADSVDASLAWVLATGLVAAYVFGRGFAKTNVHSVAWDPREAGARFTGGRGQPSETVRREEMTRQMTSVQREEYGTQVPGPMYGAGPWGYGRGIRQAYPIETKPFFLTSEFWGSLLLIVALAIGAATSDSFDARLFWILTAAVTIGYVISRGIAKSGTKSRSWDPREEITHRMRERVASGDNT